MARRQKRFEVLEQRPVNQDGFVVEWPEVGMVAMGGPNDPKPSIKVENGKIVEMDGRTRDQFDMIDRFNADYAINAAVAEKMMAIPSQEIAQMLVDFRVPREKVAEVFSGLTAAKIGEVMDLLNVVEIMTPREARGSAWESVSPKTESRCMRLTCRPARQFSPLPPTWVSRASVAWPVLTRGDW